MKIAWLYLDKRGAAIDALKDYAAMDFIIHNYEDVEEETLERKTSLCSGIVTLAADSHNPHAGESRLAATMDAVDVLKERYRQALEYMEWFQPAWNVLSDDERYMLTVFYCGENQASEDYVGQICDHFHVERSSAYNKKNRALAHLVLLLYGK